MPTRDDSSPRHKAIAVVRHEDEYARDWHQITGERFSLESLAERVHPDDFGRVNASRVEAIRTGRFCEEYRVRDARGRYVWVRGETRVCNGRWLGGVKIIQRDDKQHLCAKLGCVCRIFFGGCE
jgi:hypothetical protein